MFKKIYLFSAIALTSIPALGIFTTPDLTNQLSHIRTQMFAIKRAWNTARIHIKMAQKASPILYQTIKPTLEKVISSDIFTAKINTIVSEQFDAIANKNMSFVKTEFNLSDFLPNLTMHAYGKNLFSAMAQREYCLLLGRQLAPKMQELEIAIQSAQQPS